MKTESEKNDGLSEKVADTALRMYRTSNTTFTDCKFLNSGWSGTQINSQQTNITFNGCEFSDNAFGGLVCDANYTTVVNCEFYDNIHSGISLSGDHNNITGNTIRDNEAGILLSTFNASIVENTIENNLDVGISVNDYLGLFAGITFELDIIKNTIKGATSSTNSSQSGISVWDVRSLTRILNNTVRRYAKGIEVKFGSGVSVKYNDITDCPTGIDVMDVNNVNITHNDISKATWGIDLITCTGFCTDNTISICEGSNGICIENSSAPLMIVENNTCTTVNCNAIPGFELIYLSVAVITLLGVIVAIRKRRKMLI